MTRDRKILTLFVVILLGIYVIQTYARPVLWVDVAMVVGFFAFAFAVAGLNARLNRRRIN